MAHFARVNLVMGEDLNTSLWALVTTAKGACSDLHKDIRVALGPIMYGMAEANITGAIKKYHQRINSSLTQTLVFLDCARRDAHSFLKDRATDLKSTEEFEEMATALSEHLSNHECQVWDVIMSPDMSDPRVSSRVNAALSAIQPMVANYFGGILKGLIGCLSLSPSRGEGPAHSIQEGVEKQVAIALQRQISTVGGIKLGSLHVDYSHNFATRDIGISIPTLSSTALPNLLETMDHLCANLPPVLEKLRPLLKEEDLFARLIQKNIAERGENAEVYQQLKLGPKEGDPAGTPPTPPGDRSPPLPANPFPENSDQARPPLTHNSPGTEPISIEQPDEPRPSNPGDLLNSTSKRSTSQPPTPLDRKPVGKGSRKVTNLMEVDSQEDPRVDNDNSDSKGKTELINSMSRKQKSDIVQNSGSTPKKQKPGPPFVEGITLQHEPDTTLTFICKVTTNKDSSGQTQSLSEDEEGASGTEGDSQRVTATPFISDDDPTSPEAKRKAIVPPNLPPILLPKQLGASPRRRSKRRWRQRTVRCLTTPEEGEIILMTQAVIQTRTYQVVKRWSRLGQRIIPC